MRRIYFHSFPGLNFLNFGNGFGKFLDDRDHAILPHAYLMSISELRNNANKINRLIELKFIYQTGALQNTTIPVPHQY